MKENEIDITSKDTYWCLGKGKQIPKTMDKI